MAPVQTADQDTPASPVAELAAALDLQRLEIAGRYLFANLLPLPLIVLGISLLLWSTHPPGTIMAWAMMTVASWSVTTGTLHIFLRDTRRSEHTTRWTIIICATLFVSSTAFASGSMIFWIDGDRLNNIIMYTLMAGALAGAGAQSAPSKPVVIANMTPYALVFLQLSLGHEVYPDSLGFAFLQVCYIVLVALTARTVWQLADEMLRLRHDKRALIDRLHSSLVETKSARAKAEAANRAKSEFLANMSHELRTPLNAVLGFSEIIKERSFGDAADRYAEYGEHIHFSGKHLLGLIGDILDLSKIEAGRRELDESIVDLTELATDALRFVEPQAERKGLNLKLDAQTRITLRGDERALRQVMVNLLSNAVKFTPQAGSIILSISHGSDGAVIAVRDSGIGIDPMELGKVMERFGQARHDIASSDEQGTGLGLPIVKGLTELHGGTIRITSKPGEGTTVTITLPENRIVQRRNQTSAA
ncbi:MAG: HAMP domain-containing sensor histidine kinase [Micropepsaceae bacterium]